MNEFDIKRCLISYLYERYSAPVIASEVPFAFRSRRCDLMAIIEDELVAFEIKSDRDNFVKLESQLTDYVKTYDRTYLVTTENMLNRPFSMSANIGLLVINSNGTLSEVIPAETSSSLELGYRLDMLTSNKLKQTFSFCRSTSTKSESIEAITEHSEDISIYKKLMHVLYEDFNKVSQIFYSEVGDIKNLTEDDLSLLEMRSHSLPF